MEKNRLKRLKEFYEEHGFRGILRLVFKLLFPIWILLQVYLFVGTPYLFNTFEYNYSYDHLPLAELATDKASIKAKLKPKTEKMFSGSMKKAPYGICYVHGFSASRQELEPVISNVAKKLNANLFLTRLEGHGFKNPDELKAAKAQGWIEDVLECVAVASRSGERVILIGTSMGAALSSLVAANSKYKIHSLILISPYFGVKDRKSDLLAGYYGGYIADYYFKGYRSFPPVNELQQTYWTTRYPAFVLKQVMIVSQAVRAMDFSQLKVPVFVAYSKQDEVIDIDQMLLKYEQIVSQKRLDADPSYTSHVLAGDIVNPSGNAQLQKNIYSFIKANY